MKRMKKYSYILLALPLLLGSCEAYLDVNPKSEVTDKELFSTAKAAKTPSTASIPRWEPTRTSSPTRSRSPIRS